MRLSLSEIKKEEKVMIEGLFFIFLFQLAGTALSALFGFPVPGPVIGMALLLIWLALSFKTPTSLINLCDFFLRYLPLLFVPAAVGVLNYKDIMIASGLSLAEEAGPGSLTMMNGSGLNFMRTKHGIKS